MINNMNKQPRHGGCESIAKQVNCMNRTQDLTTERVT